jgi:NDP-sugar pyrophosphorylase family protein
METPDTVILAGGRGTRLGGPVPKPLMPVAGRPFLDHLLARVGGRVILALGHGADLFAAYADRAVLSIESEPLGTGGALRLALAHIRTEDVLVLNGDTFVDTDLASLVNVHRSRGDAITLLAVTVDDAARYGRVDTSAAGDVLRFVEKGASGPGAVNAGVYVFRRDAIESIDAGRAVSLEREVLPSWIGRGLRAAVRPCRFIDIGTPEAYGAAENFFRHS